MPVSYPYTQYGGIWKLSAASAAQGAGTWATPPAIISTNLVVYLNAKNYSGSGSTWTDASGNGNNATLVNSPTYTSTGGSYFTFNGTNQYATTSSVSTAKTNTTIQVWVNVVTPQKGCFVVNGNNDTFSYGVGIGNGNMDTTGSNLIGLQGGYAWYPTSYTYNSGWQLVSMVLGTSGQLYLYVNDTLQGTFSYAFAGSPSGGIVIAAETTALRFFGGSIGAVLFYSTALTQTQIAQNYTALRGQYGV
jgi:hypothetical protein